jgi:hypothetical protein
MLRDVVIHVNNEQPILADLVAEPTSLDNCVVCTNLRTMSGTTPVFVERSDSTFVIPLATIRFIEIRPASEEDGDLPALVEVVGEPHRKGKGGKPTRDARPEPPDEDTATACAVSPLSRLGWLDGAAGAQYGSPTDSLEAREELETDEGELLRRVREA